MVFRSVYLKEYPVIVSCLVELRGCVKGESNSRWEDIKSKLTSNTFVRGP